VTTGNSSNHCSCAAAVECTAACRRALINAMRALAGVTNVGLDVPLNPLAIADEVIE
jgi:hypothetical protein